MDRDENVRHIAELTEQVEGYGELDRERLETINGLRSELALLRRSLGGGNPEEGNCNVEGHRELVAKLAELRNEIAA
jgi:hypothetical protein